MAKTSKQLRLGSPPAIHASAVGGLLRAADEHHRAARRALTGKRRSCSNALLHAAQGVDSATAATAEAVGAGKKRLLQRAAAGYDRAWKLMRKTVKTCSK